MQRTNVHALIGGLGLVGLVGCETYELPPRLLGVATEDCSDCEELELSETRLPPGVVTLTADFSFEDERGALDELRAFVSTPSGRVLKEGGVPCSFVVDLAEQVGVESCAVTSLRFGDSGDTLFARLRGIESGVLTARLGLDLDEAGTWTVGFEATRDTGANSNRLSGTFEVAGSVDPE